MSFCFQWIPAVVLCPSSPCILSPLIAKHLSSHFKFSFYATFLATYAHAKISCRFPKYNHYNLFDYLYYAHIFLHSRGSLSPPPFKQNICLLSKKKKDFVKACKITLSAVVPGTKDEGRSIGNFGVMGLVSVLIIVVISYLSKPSELNILKGHQLLHINYTSIKLIKKIKSIRQEF